MRSFVCTQVLVVETVDAACETCTSLVAVEYVPMRTSLLCSAARAKYRNTSTVHSGNSGSVDTRHMCWLSTGADHFRGQYADMQNTTMILNTEMN